MVVCDDVLYYYVQSTNSSIRRAVSEKMLDILAVTDIVLREFQERGIYEQFREPLDCALIYGILYILDMINAEDVDHPFQTVMADYIHHKFPAYGRNPFVSDSLRRALDYLTAHEFKKYHYRILVLGHIKEWLLQNPAVAKLNELRRR